MQNASTNYLTDIANKSKKDLPQDLTEEIGTEEIGNIIETPTVFPEEKSLLEITV